MAVNREPAIRRAHPSDVLPERPTAAPQAQSVRPAPMREAAAQESVARVSPTVGEKLSETHNSRIRPSTKDRLRRAVDKLRYDTGDRSISEASLTDAAIDQYLKDQGL